MRRPLDGEPRVSSPFGTRKDPISGKERQFHPGIDYAVPEGTPVYAVADGTVSRSYTSDPPPPMKSYGERIIIQHDHSMESSYAHLSKRLVVLGEKVKEGQLIGYTGNTGASTGPHLHLEIRVCNTPVDPVSVFINHKC